MRALRDFCEPVPDAALPRLAQQKRRGVLAFASIIAVVAIAWGGLDVALGASDAWRSAVVVAGSVLVCATSALVVLRCARACADAALLAVSATIVVSLALDGWSRLDGQNSLLSHAALLPVVIAAFAPWRPSYSLLLALIGCGIVAGGEAVGVVHLPTEAASMYVLTACAGLGGAVAAQMQRRLWRKLEAASAQLAASERVVSLGRMTAGIAHELKTPLAAAMNAHASLSSLAGELRESLQHPDVTGDDLREIASEIEETSALIGASVRRSTQFIQALRAHTVQRGDQATTTVDVAEVIDQSLTLLGHEIRRGGVLVDTTGAERSLTCSGDPSKLGQIVTNLVTNALDACQEGKGSSILVAAYAAGDEIVVAVEDDGPGVPEALRGRIFDLLFTTKALEGSTGLGLALCRDIAESAFGGTLELVPRDRGARFELRISTRSRSQQRRETWTPGVSHQAAPPEAEG